MKDLTPIKKSALWLAWLLISGCASQIPPEIRQALDNSPGVTQVHADAELYIAQKVRWGGTILKTENKNAASWMTIVAYPLNTRGKPLSSEQSPGRFIAISDQFLEPQDYDVDRKVTIIGDVLRVETAQVDEFVYQYPVIQVDQVYLWPIQQERQYTKHSPFWYDPWYDLFYNRYYRRQHLFYPYRYPYYRRHHLH